MDFSRLQNNIYERYYFVPRDNHAAKASEFHNIRIIRIDSDILDILDIPDNQPINLDFLGQILELQHLLVAVYFNSEGMKCRQKSTRSTTFSLHSLHSGKRIAGSTQLHKPTHQYR